jgi:hypothetical protein
MLKRKASKPKRPPTYRQLICLILQHQEKTVPERSGALLSILRLHKRDRRRPQWRNAGIVAVTPIKCTRVKVLLCGGVRPKATLRRQRVPEHSGGAVQ